LGALCLVTHLVLVGTKRTDAASLLSLTLLGLSLIVAPSMMIIFATSRL
jgi:hypothetical protein